MLVHPISYNVTDRYSRTHIRNSVSSSTNNTTNISLFDVAESRHIHQLASDNSLVEYSEALRPELSSVNQINNIRDVIQPSLSPNALNTDLHSGSYHFPIVTQKAHIPERLRDLVELLYLQQRDRQVRAHENSHLMVANGLAGTPIYQYQRGSDGHNYAISGQINMNTDVYAGKQERQLDQLQKIYRAALAPLNPSVKDLQIAVMVAHRIRSVEHEMASELNQCLDKDRLIMVVSDHYRLCNASKM